MRPVPVTSGRHPFEVAVLAASAVAGLLLFATDTSPGSVREGMPGAVQTVWQVGLVVAGVVGLVGLWWQGRRLDDGLAVETVGVGGLGTVCAMYTAALFVVSGTQAIAAGAFVAAVAAASWWRIGQIIKDMHRGVAAAEEDGENS